jgi:lauroyl/myristoyl acyltransferase
LYNARQTLQRGGFASVVADGGVGTSPGITLPFFGRQRTFKTGFAELALVSGASVVPVTVSMDITGHAELRFMPLLEIPSSDRQQQIESLVRQYADLLRSEWIEKTGNLSWRELEAFLKLPLIDQ